jgi:solute:Na+ symporter, SSS family
MFSIVATETSVLTFISVPGIAYRGDWTFLQLSLGYILGRILVSYFLLPIYYKEGVVSIYEVLGEKYGHGVQKIASGLFLITRIFADGIRYLATAVIIQVITGWSIPIAVCIIGICTLIYSITGGIKTIIWIDALQFLIYLSGGIIVITLVLSSFDISFIYSQLIEASKIKIFNFSGNPFFTSMNFYSAVIGGTIFSFASHGTDYMMVQRCLSCKDLKSAKKAMIGSGIFVFFQFGLFLLAGSLIFIYFEGIEIQKDREFSTFILEVIPSGLKGLLLAGVLSAAMSTLSSSMNSLASSTIIDWMKVKSNQILKMRIVSIIWGIVLMGIALMFDESDKAIVIVGFRIASFTYGGLLVLFLCLKTDIIQSQFSVIIGLITSIITVFLLDKYEFAWTWFVLISALIGFITSIIFEKIKVNLSA